jgi:hypothetical protein
VCRWSAKGGEPQSGEKSRDFAKPAGRRIRCIPLLRCCHHALRNVVPTTTAVKAILALDDTILAKSATARFTMHIRVVGGPTHCRADDFDWEVRFVAKSINDWMREGEELYLLALKDFEELTAQLEDVEKRHAIKKDEVNQIARIIGKPIIETNRRVMAELMDDQDGPSPNSSSTIARALTGRNLTR